jgi:L-ascorbate metabolism protein UlaG (beta-lactamase superfamily)
VTTGLTTTGRAAGEAQDSEALEVVYLGNEGFLLQTLETAVLVDALFGDGLFGYDVVPPDERRKLENAVPPYDEIVLALASHVHGDHFSAEAVASFLRASPATQFVASEQAVRRLLRLDPTLADRTRALSPDEGESVTFSAGNIELTAFNLHHGANDVQNLGLLVEICGLKVLHMGDTEASATDMRTAGLDDLRPDVAMLPSWYLRPGRWLDAIDDVIRPRRIVAMHIPASEAPSSYFWGGLTSREDLVRAIRELRDEAFVPTASGQSITLACLEDD